MSPLRDPPPPSAGRLQAARWILGGLALLAALALAVPFGRALLAPMPPVRLSLEEPFNHGLVSPATGLSLRGFVAAPKGFSLPAGQEGEILCRIRLERPLTAWSAITLQWFGGATEMQSAVDLVSPGGPHRLLTDRTAAGARVPLPAAAAGATELALRFSARHAGPEPLLLLDKLVVQSWEGPLPSRPAVGWLAAIGVGLTLGLAGLCRRPVRVLAAGGMLILAACLRYANLLRVAAAPLDPDAQGYLEHARTLSLAGPGGFYAAAFGEREPLHPAAVKAALWAFGDAELSVRLLTVVLSVAVVYLGYRLGASALGWGTGLAAGLLLAVWLPAIIESGRGLRVELEALLLTGAAWALFGPPGALSVRRALLAGILAGGLALTRFPYMVTLLLLFAASAWWHRRRIAPAWAGLGVAVLVAGLLVIPHRAALALRHGDPAYDAHRTARWIANQEFQGQPGFPSPEALARDGFIGGPLPLRDYYLGLHTPGEVVVRTARGMAKALGNLVPVGYVHEVTAMGGRLVAWADPVLSVLALLGLLVLARDPRARWVPGVLALGLLHVAFVYDLGLPDYRFRMILQVAPLAALLCATGAAWAGDRVRRQAAAWHVAGRAGERDPALAGRSR